MGLTTTPQPLFYNVKKTEILVEKASLIKDDICKQKCVAKCFNAHCR